MPLATARPQALAGGALEALLACTDELAQRWAAALVLARPLSSIGTLALEEVAGTGPALCAQLLRALTTEEDLELLVASRGPRGEERSAPVRGLAAISGVGDPAALVHTTEALRGVLWQALLAHAGEQSAHALAELGDRLAHVCAVALAAAIGERPDARASDAPARPDSRSLAPGAGGGFAVPGARPPAGGALAGATIVDERVQAPEPEISVRDQRGGEAPAVRDQRSEGPAAWVGAISARLQRFAVEREPFAVVLVELADLERLREDPKRLTRAAARLEDALSLALGPGPVELTRERAGRCWVLASVEDRSAVERLEQRLRGGVEAYARRHEKSLALAAGSALCPEDGTHAAALAAHADLSLYADRAGAGTRRSASQDPA